MSVLTVAEKQCAPRIRSSLVATVCRWLALMALLALAWLAHSTSANAADPSKATSSRAARDEAIRLIPLNKLDPQARAQVQYVLKHVSVYRRLPVQVVRADPALYQYFLEHPDVTVKMWRMMGLTQLKVDRTDEARFSIDDNQGTTADAQFLYRDHDTHVVYTRGVYDGSMFPKAVQGHVVMLLKTGYVREPNGEFYITSRLDTFIRMDNVGLDLIAKTFNPLVGRIIDDNFVEAMKFVGSFSKTAGVNPEAMLALAERMDNVDPQDQDLLLQIVSDVGDKAEAVRLANATSPIVDRPRNASAGSANRRR
ncbi:MAG: hypothetical protein AB7O62_24050 [Pirellulales bacterium]